MFINGQANRKAKEEANRKEASRKAKEEANRKAKEEANRKAKENANRKAKEEANRKAKEEANRKEANRKAAEERKAAQNKLKRNVIAYMNKPEIKQSMKNVDRQSILNKVNRKERNFTTMNGIQRRVDEYVVAFKAAKKEMELKKIQNRVAELQLGNRGNSIIKRFSAPNSKMTLAVAIKFERTRKTSRTSSTPKRMSKHLKITCQRRH